MKNLQKNIPLTALSLATAALISACGGGSGTSASPVTLAGAVIDGYITGASVCLDLNSNGACDAGEPSSTTAANGKYTLTAPAGTDLSKLHIIATVPAGAFDSDAPTTAITAPYKMLAPAGTPNVISPLTTIVSTKMIASSLTLANARIAARTDLSLPIDYDFGKDHVATNDTGAHNVAKVMAAILAVKVGTGTPNATTLGQALTQITTGGTAATAYGSSDVTGMVTSILGSSAPTPTPTPTPTPSGTVVLNFDSTVPTGIRDDGALGGTAAPTATPPAGGGSGSALRLLRSGGQTYALAVVDVAAIPFTTTRKTLSARVYSPTANIPMKIKLETTGNTANSGEVAANEAVVVGWQTLTWTFSSVDPALSWTAIVLLPNIGTIDAAPGKEYFFDDIVLNAAAPTPTPTPSPSNLVATGDFTSAASDANWYNNAKNVVTTGGNSYNLADVATAGNAYDVNLSYKLSIPTSGVRYKLRFKASSNRARTMVAGIGLQGAPYTNDVKTVDITTTQQTFELSLTSNFADANSRVIFDMGADTGQVVIDDVELVLDTSAAPTPSGGPTAAASLPTASAGNVKSIFSDSYTNVTVDEWGPDWGPASARITDGVIAGNNYKTIDMSAAGKEFAGISFVSSKFNATAYTTFNMDYWIDTPLLAGQVINIKLSNHDGSGETSAIQSAVANVTGGSWQRLSIPLNSFTQAATSLSRNNIAQIIITAARANTGLPVKVYFDNMYFSQ